MIQMKQVGTEYDNNKLADDCSGCRIAPGESGLFC
jgi:hypothetical protein